MELRLLFTLAIAGSLPLLGYTATDNVIVEGSGSGDEQDVVVVHAAVPNTDDEDIYIVDTGSGEKEPVTTDTENVPEGSGGEETTNKPTGLLLGRGPSTQTIVARCEGTECNCFYPDGTKVPNTQTFAKKPENCDQYAAGASTTRKDVPTTTSSLNLPTRVKESPAPEIVKESPAAEIVKEVTVTDQTPDIHFASEQSTTQKKLSPAVILVKSTDAKPSPTMGNKVPTVTPKVLIADKEKELQKNEEETNMIGDNLYLNAVEKEEIAAGSVYISHPGILAAIIGGGIVGLLCAILLVMFIVYRMRKKDEGSYPLNDSKPLKDYAYSKAPSREFYA